MKATLNQVETHLQRLVEGSLARLFPNEWKNNPLATHLLDAMRENLQPEQDPRSGMVLAPDFYTIHLPVHQTIHPTTNHQLAISLTQNLIEAIEGSGIHFKNPPVVQMTGDADLRTGQVRVTAKFRNDQADETQSFSPLTTTEYSPTYPHAFLIYDRTEIFPLDIPVVTLGRQWDADFILDDPRISRLHAQIRMVDNRFVIFDLDSTGGTFVNGQRVQQRVLFRGDVLSLAGVELIFGQDEEEDDETRPMKKPGASAEPFA